MTIHSKKLFLLFALLIVPFTLNSGQPKLQKVVIKMRPNSVSPWIDLRLWEAGKAVTGDKALPIAPLSQFKLSVSASGGNWVGVSFRDSRGTIYDVPAHKSRLIRGYADFEWRMPNTFARGAVEVTIALWQDYDEKNDKMVGELDRIPWTKLGDCGTCN